MATLEERELAGPTASPWRITLQELGFAVLCGYFVLGFQLVGVVKRNLGVFLFDKIFLVLLLGTVLVSVAKSRNERPLRIELQFALVCAFYFAYSVAIGSNVFGAIVVDLINEAKPFLALFLGYSLHFHFTPRRRQILRLLCLFGTFQVLVVGLTGTVWTYFNHPSIMAAMATVCPLLYLYCSSGSRQSTVIAWCMMATGLLSGRSKFFAFFAITTILLMIGHRRIHFRLSPRTLAILVGCSVLGLVAASGKIKYYAVRMDSENMARPMILMTSGKVLVDYVPFGSGLATLGNISAWENYSPTYVKYGLDKVFGFRPDESFTFSMDTYLPCLAQFGIAGILLLALFGRKIVGKIDTLPGQAKISAFLLLLFLVIDSLADTTVTSFRGIFTMVLIGAILGGRVARPSPTPVRP